MIGVITTIFEPTECIKQLASELRRRNAALTIVGDKKGPAEFQLEGAELLSLEQQLRMPFELSRSLPVGHYARKNVGYLHAFKQDADCIYETDDDNAPLESWQPRSLTIEARIVSTPGWANVYKLFTEEFIWPRGFPLDQIRNGEIHNAIEELPVRQVTAPIQQGLADDSPDVDAVWRLLHDKPITFERNPSVHLEPGTWCPFNSQSTWWWPEAYPLMYLPSYCSFRMTDIWRSFVAQRCLWELGYGVVFHASEVFQDRNAHDLMKDFEAEIPGYKGNQALVDVLESLTLRSGKGNGLDNLVKCYESLITAGFFPDAEMQLVRAWVHDVESLT